MLRQVFSEEVEAKLIQLWGEHVKTKSGTMMKRSVKEKEVAEALTAYSRQLGDTESVYTASVIHSKIDNLKTKAKEHYKRFRRMTATGRPVGDPSEDGAFDLAAAVATWSNFKTWHREFSTVPGFGPQSSLSSTSFVESSDPGTQVAQLPTPAAQPQPSSDDLYPRPNLSGADSEEDDTNATRDLLLFGPSSPLPSTPGGPHASSPQPSAATPTARSLSPSAAASYIPGSHGAKRNAASQDPEDHGSVGAEVAKKKKRKVAGTGGGIEAVMSAFTNSQRELQQNQQRFTTALIEQQREHTQALIQSQIKQQQEASAALMNSQMAFQAKLFAELFKEK